MFENNIKLLKADPPKPPNGGPYAVGLATLLFLSLSPSLCLPLTIKGKRRQ